MSRVDLDERAALCALMLERGPEAPTLCAGWAVRDLAAHLAIRERRPDAAPGMFVPALAEHTRRVQERYATDWPRVVELVRQGPPPWMPTRLAAIGEPANTVEFYVHHEDVRRAEPGWQPRPEEPKRDAALFTALRRMATLTLRKSPGPVILRASGYGEVRAGPAGGEPVTVSGDPGELVLFAFGRDAYRLDFDGSAPAVERLREAKRAL